MLDGQPRSRPVVSETIQESGPASLDIPDKIRELAELGDAGILTQEEFESKKHTLLKRL